MAQMTALCVETQILVTSDQKEIMNNCAQNVKLQKYLIIFHLFFKFMFVQVIHEKKSKFIKVLSIS